VGPRTSLDDAEKRKILLLPGLELRPLGRPARTQSLPLLDKGMVLYAHLLFLVQGKRQPCHKNQCVQAARPPVTGRSNRSLPSSVSRPALGPTHLPMQCIPWAKAVGAVKPTTNL
jgi:hypothetical protein